jgi:hypothetical protein
VQDPLWEDLGYHGEVKMSLADSFKSVHDAAWVAAEELKTMLDDLLGFTKVPDDLKADPAPDWK